MDINYVAISILELFRIAKIRMMLLIYSRILLQYIVYRGFRKLHAETLESYIKQNWIITAASCGFLMGQN